jgi:peptidoglycan/LPS O-acetylase OafA/YrhL
MERRVRGFDGIRGLAALWIVVRHVGLLDNLDAHGLGFLMPLLVMRRRLRLLMVLLFAYAVVAPLGSMAAYQHGLGSRFFPARWSIFAGEYVAAGCLAALAFDRFPAWFGRSRRWWLVLGAGCYFGQLLNGSTWITNAGITALIVYVVRAQGSARVRMLEWPVMRYLGRVSYGIYVWQSFAITTGPAKVGSWPLDLPWNLLLLITIVPISWHFVEQPCLRLKDRFRPPGRRDVEATGATPILAHTG